MLDGKTGKPRTVIDIEKAALVSAEEGPNAPRFRRFRGVEGTSTRLNTGGDDGMIQASFPRLSNPSFK
jgi:hypothetical protein